MGAVVVTGTSSGIGQACALHLDELGFHVYAGVRKAADGAALKKQASDRLVPISMDITDTAAIDAAVETVAAAAGETGLVGLVNNAGIAVVGPLEYLPLAELRRQLEVNVIGQIAVTQAFLPLLRTSTGRIVNMGSMAGKIAIPFEGAYCAAKFAMEGLTDALRMELRPWGISVSLVEPGFVVTPIFETSMTAMKAVTEKFPKQAHDLYGAALEAVREAADKQGSSGIPASEVAKAVAHALTAKRPKTRYAVGRGVKLGAILAKFLSDRTRDRLITRSMELY
jgi:NAD(P)-dependent dehydrogenase (short-subunit alcohol dehydrogenase family)